LRPLDPEQFALRPRVQWNAVAIREQHRAGLTAFEIARDGSSWRLHFETVKKVLESLVFTQGVKVRLGAEMLDIRVPKFQSLAKAGQSHFRVILPGQVTCFVEVSQRASRIEAQRGIAIRNRLG
jgi:hypothetical protein